MSLASTTSPLEPAPGRRQFGHYILLRQIGRGGYASIYLAVHDYLNTRVAIKMLNLSLASNEEVRRFEFEARMLAHMQHRHIVRVFDFGWEGGTPFLVMEYAPNGTLYEYFPGGIPLPVETILPVVSQLAGALQYIHNRNLIHCDVKPENVLLGPRNQLWLSDFGIATTQFHRSQHYAEELRGTARFVAPEQMSDRPVCATDQYALAVMVYQWLCGRPPFLESGLELCRQQLYEPPPRLRDLVPTIPRKVEKAVLKALAKDPAQRYAHIQEFAQAIK